MKRLINNVIPRAGLILAALLLASCGNDKEHKELLNYVKNVKQRKSYNIEPIPKLTVPQKFDYPKNHTRDPFFEVVEKRTAGVNAPDQRRDKETLESFALDSLRMVGVLRQNEKMWAVVSAPDGGVYRIHEGNYLGRNFGKVKKVNSTMVELEETVQVNGVWEKRAAKIALVEGE